MPRLSSHFGLMDPRLQSLTFPLIVPVTNATDANQTYTAAQVLGGFISRAVTAARTDTMPTAAAMCEAVQGCMVGTSFEFYVRSTGAGAVTVAVGAGGTLDSVSTASVATLNTRTFKLIFTNVAIGSEAYTLFSLGASAT